MAAGGRGVEAGQKAINDCSESKIRTCVLVLRYCREKCVLVVVAGAGSCVVVLVVLFSWFHCYGNGIVVLVLRRSSR